MELRHLRYFVAVAESENVTRAASRLHVTQPALSRQIRDLEEILELTLFERGAKSLHLTRAGRLFLNEAKEVIAKADQALFFAKTLSENAQYILRIGYAPSLNVELLPLTLKVLQQSYPKIEIQLRDLSTEEMLLGLKDQSIDVALMVRTESLEERGLIFKKLSERAICVAGAPDHPVLQKATLLLEDLQNYPLLAYAEKDYPEYTSWLRRLFAMRHLPLKVAEEHDGASSLVTSLQSGTGLALVQEGFQTFAGARIKVCELASLSAPFVLGVAWSEVKQNAVVESFVNAATTAVARLSPS